MEKVCIFGETCTYSCGSCNYFITTSERIWVSLDLRLQEGNRALNGLGITFLRFFYGNFSYEV